MYNRERLIDLEENLEILYKKLGRYEKKISITASESEKFDLMQQIKDDIIPAIRKYEVEYWELYPKEAIIISEEEAESQLIQIEEAVESIERVSSANYPPELLLLLQDIRSKLAELDKPASARFKLALPIIPAIASYEMEIDTEGFVKKIWWPAKEFLRKRTESRPND